MAYGYQHPGYAPPYQQPPDPARQNHSYPHGQYEQPQYGPSPVPGAMPAAAPPQQYGYRPPPGPHAQHSPRECFNCGAPNHWAQNCPEPRRAVPAGSAWRSHDSHPNKRPRSHGPVVTQYPVPPDYAAHPHPYGQPQRVQPPPRPAPFSPETHQYGPPPSTPVQYMPPQYGPSFVEYGPPQPRAMSPPGAGPWPAHGYNYPTAHVPPHSPPNQYPPHGPHAPHGPHGYPVPPQYSGHYSPPVPPQAYGNPNVPRPQQPQPHHLQGPSPYRGPPYAAPYASPQAGRTPRPRFRHHRLSVPDQQPKDQLQLQADQSQPQVLSAGPQPQEAVSPGDTSNPTDEVDEDEYLKLDFVWDPEPRIPTNRVARPLLADSTAPGSFEALLIVAADYSDSASEYIRYDNFDEVTTSIRLTRYWAEMAEDPVFRQIHTGDDASPRGKQESPHEATLSTDMHGARDGRTKEAISPHFEKHNRQGIAPISAAVGQSEPAGSSLDGRTMRTQVHPGEKQQRQRSASPGSHGRHRANDQSPPGPGSANNYRERSPIGSRKRESAETNQTNRSSRDKPGGENHGLDGTNDAGSERLRQADNAWARLKKRQPQVADAYSRRW